MKQIICFCGWLGLLFIQMVSAQTPMGPPSPLPDSSAFRGNLFEWQQQRPLPYDQSFSSQPLYNGETQSANLVQIRGKLNLHYHNDHDEMVYILSGKGIMVVGSQTKVVLPGDLIIIPRRTAHSAECKSAEPLVALSIMSPPFDGKDRIYIE